jgi:hypothetical protein
MRFCIATWELRHFSPGGIGVFVHNLLTVYGSTGDAEISILWYGNGSLNERLFRRAFANCRFFAAEEWARRDEEEDDGIWPPEKAYRLARQWQSYRLMRALRAIEREHGPFDVIEFPDHGGAAYATLQEKRLGRGFARSRIAVRLHGTESALRRYDHRPSDLGNPIVADLERKALSDADIVVGHLDSVVDDVQDHFGFTSAWRNKVVVEHPPVLTDSPVVERSIGFEEDTSLVFTSKVQWVKRPDVFINGVVGFMEAEPEYKGDALVLAHIVDDEFRMHCLGLIPLHLKDRFTFRSDLSTQMRERIIARSVAVFPTAYECFCLAGYEASKLGALVLVNNQNPAFELGTPWVPGENCEVFDGTAGSLANALREMWHRRDALVQRPVHISPPAAPYWLRQEADAAGDQVRLSSVRPKLSVIIPSSSELGDPGETIRSALLSQDSQVEIILVYDVVPSEADRSAVLKRLEGSVLVGEGVLKIIRLGFCGGIGALCNRGIREATGDVIALVRAGATIDATFLGDAARALGSSGEYDVVVPQLSLQDRGSEEGQLEADTVRIGEALNSALALNLFGGIEMVVRRSVAAAIKFDETLDRYGDWDFHLRACAAGHKYIASNRIDVRLEAMPDRESYFRAHFDDVLAKHSVKFSGGKCGLVSAFDARRADEPVASRTEERKLSLYARRARMRARLVSLFGDRNTTRLINVARWIVRDQRLAGIVAKRLLELWRLNRPHPVPGRF